ncbi:Uncoordinated protein 79 [Intoshia linei]|uniref:Uncoordinated protein 79 n=1 Tax=Intoshia linei TaxID=1819745 RepID=A0A177B040_9BILA|nr:Uncoordinated protein 79 [Intoshia linei]
MTHQSLTFNSKCKNLIEFYNAIIFKSSPMPQLSEFVLKLRNCQNILEKLFNEIVKNSKNVNILNYYQLDQEYITSLSRNYDFTLAFEASLKVCIIINIMETQDISILVEVFLLYVSYVCSFLPTPLLEKMALPITRIIPSIQQKKTKHTIIRLLSTRLIPILSLDENENKYYRDSIPGILMIIFEYIDDYGSYFEVMDSIIKHETEAIKLVMNVIAYGALRSRRIAVIILFRYWPILYSANIPTKKEMEFVGFWTCVRCDNEECKGKSDGQYPEANRIAYNVKSKRAAMLLPNFLCINCAMYYYPNEELLPIYQVNQKFVKSICKRKNCKGGNKLATYMCTHVDCHLENYLLCSECNQNHEHLTQKTILDIWDESVSLVNIFVDAVSRLLCDINTVSEKMYIDVEIQHIKNGGIPISTDVTELVEIEIDFQHITTQYAIFLLVNHVKLVDFPNDESDQVKIKLTSLIRLCASLFEWYNSTGCVQIGSCGINLENLKSNLLEDWINLLTLHFADIVIACLLPYPMELTKIGGVWDLIADKFICLKVNLRKLSHLIPYKILTCEIWDYIMPFWMEAILSDLNEKQQIEITPLIIRLFDADLICLFMTIEEFYNFAYVRLLSSKLPVILQVLQWIDMLTNMDVSIPEKFLYLILNETMSNIDDMIKSKKFYSSSDVINCYYYVASILVKQTKTLSIVSKSRTTKRNQITDAQKLQVFIKILQSRVNLTKCNENSKKGLVSLLSVMYSTVIFLIHKIDYINFSVSIETVVKVLSTDYTDNANNIEKFIFFNDYLNLHTKLTENVVNACSLYSQLMYYSLKWTDSDLSSEASTLLLKIAKHMIIHAKCSVVYQYNELSDTGHSLIFLAHTTSYQFVNRLWNMMQWEPSASSIEACQLLLFILNIQNASKNFVQLVKDNFNPNKNNPDTIFSSVEKATTILKNARNSPHTNHFMYYSLSYLFARVLDILCYPVSMVRTKARILLNSLPRVAFDTLMTYFEYHFQIVSVDRYLILTYFSRIEGRQNFHSVYSWKFFQKIFELIDIEKKLDNYEKNSDMEPYEIMMMPVTLEELTKKLDYQLFLKNNAKMIEERYTIKFIDGENDFTNYYNSQMNKILFNDDIDVDFENVKTEKKKPKDKNLRERVYKNGYNIDTLKSTLHISWHFMKFLRKGIVKDVMDKEETIVMDYVNSLIFYDSKENCFTNTPQNVRESPIFETIIAELPSILDFNIERGKSMISFIISFLKYCPYPHVYKYDAQHSNFSISVLSNLAKYDFSIALNQESVLYLLNIILCGLLHHVHALTKLKCSVCMKYDVNVDETSYEETDDLVNQVVKSYNSFNEVDQSIKNEKNEKKDKNKRNTTSKGIICSKCLRRKEEYTNEIVGLSILCIGTLVQREPELISSYLPQIISVLSEIMSYPLYNWQKEMTQIYIQGDAAAVARSILNVILHQFSDKDIFVRLIFSQISNSYFKYTIHMIMKSFGKLTNQKLIKLLLEGINNETISNSKVFTIITNNLKNYLKHFTISTNQVVVVNLFEIFVKNVKINNLTEINTSNLFCMIKRVLELFTSVNGKVIYKFLETVSRLFSDILFYLPINYLNICDMSNFLYQTYSKDKGGYLILKMVMTMLSQSLKIKTNNCLFSIYTLIQIVGHECSINFYEMYRDLREYSIYLGKIKYKTKNQPLDLSYYNNFKYLDMVETVLLPHLSDLCEFLNNTNLVYKIKESNQVWLQDIQKIILSLKKQEDDLLIFKSFTSTFSQSEDNLHYIKISVAIIVSLIFSTNAGVGKGNQELVGYGIESGSGMKDDVTSTQSENNHRTTYLIYQYLPWLNCSDANSYKDFEDTLSRIRILSWILLGYLDYIYHNNYATKSSWKLPVPLECHKAVSDNIINLISKISELPKSSVWYMSSMMYIFSMCQLWTFYIEASIKIVKIHYSSNVEYNTKYQAFLDIITTFWNDVITALIFMAENNMMETVNIHFVNTMKTFAECDSIIYPQLMVLWKQMFSQNKISQSIDMKLKQITKTMYKRKTGNENALDALRLMIKKTYFQFTSIELQSANVNQLYVS